MAEAFETGWTVVKDENPGDEWYPWMEPADDKRLEHLRSGPLGKRAEFKVIDGMIWARDY